MSDKKKDDENINPRTQWDAEDAASLEYTPPAKEENKKDNEEKKQ